MPTTIVDDGDPSIEYIGTWVRGGTGSLSNELQGTAHSLQSIIAGAGVDFSFTGTSVAVYGTIGNRNQYTGAPPASVYSIDGVNQDVYIPPSPGPLAQFRVLFYESSELSNENHQLSLRVNSGGGPFILDFIEFTVPDEALSDTQPTSRLPSITQVTRTRTSTSSTTSLSSTKSLSMFISRTMSTSVISPTPVTSPQSSMSPSGLGTDRETTVTQITSVQNTQTTTEIHSGPSAPTNPPPSNQSSGVIMPRDAIIGAMMGSVAVLAIIIFVICWRRRQRRAAYKEILPFTSTTSASVTVTKDRSVLNITSSGRRSDSVPEKLPTPTQSPSLPTVPGSDEIPPPYQSRLITPEQLETGSDHTLQNDRRLH